MTKYELYQILDENGFIPNDENVEILTEGLEDGTYIIYEDAGQRLINRQGRILRKQDVLNKTNAKLATAKAGSSLQKKLQKKANNVQKSIENKQARQAKLLDKSMTNSKIAKSVADATKKMNNNINTINKAKQGLAAMNTAHNNINGTASPAKLTNMEPDNSEGFKNDMKEKESAKLHDATEVKPTTTTEVKKDEVVKESFIFSDYELYQILDENGFETTTENLEILKEDLGVNTFIMDTTDLVLTEGMAEDYIYMQLLDNCGFLVNENNIRVLKEAIENGHILLAEAETSDDADKDKKDDEKKKWSEKSDSEKAATAEKVLKGVKTGLKVAAVLGAAGVGAAALGKAGNAIGKVNAEKAAGKAAETAKTATGEAESARALADATKVMHDNKEQYPSDAEIPDAQKVVDTENAAKDKEAAAAEAKTKSEYKNNTYGKRDSINKHTAAAAAIGGAAAGGATAAVLAKKKKKDDTPKAETTSASA